MTTGNGNGLAALERDLEVLRDFATLELKDGDLLVVTVDARLTDAARARLTDQLLSLAHHTGRKRVKPVILEACSLAILRGGAE